MGKKLSPSLISFEIEFIENVLEQSPNFIEAIAALAELHTLNGNHEKGLKLDLRLSKLRPEDPIVFYNLSCSYSLLKKVNEAFEAMKKAIEFGYDDIIHLKHDSDLQCLREDSRFHQLLSALKI